MLTVSKIEEIINTFAPFDLAADWDNSGIQVGDSTQKVSKIFLTLDISMPVIEEAIEKKCDLIISHHPLIFSPLSRIIFGEGKGRLIKMLIDNYMTLISAHTNMDRCEGGMNDFLARRLDLEKVELLQADEKTYKLVVFIPETDLHAVKESLHKAGAGEFNKYDMAGFYARGTGTFRPLAGSDPAVGEKGDYTEVSEFRLETIFPAWKMEKIMSALHSAHPYEEPAYDIIELVQHKGELISPRRGQLSDGETLEDFINKIKEKLGLDKVRYQGELTGEVTEVAVACGSGSDFISPAEGSDADVLVTGDIKYHDWQEIESQEMAVIDAGHYGTEKIFIELMQNILETSGELEDKDIEIIPCRSCSRPWQLI